jgi:hypothetical protein
VVVRLCDIIFISAAGALSAEWKRVDGRRTTRMMPDVKIGLRSVTDDISSTFVLNYSLLAKNIAYALQDSFMSASSQAVASMRQLPLLRLFGLPSVASAVKQVNINSFSAHKPQNCGKQLL